MSRPTAAEIVELLDDYIDAKLRDLDPHNLGASISARDGKLVLEEALRRALGESTRCVCGDGFGRHPWQRFGGRPCEDCGCASFRFAVDVADEDTSTEDDED